MPSGFDPNQNDPFNQNGLGLGSDPTSPMDFGSYVINPDGSITYKMPTGSSGGGGSAFGLNDPANSTAQNAFAGGSDQLGGAAAGSAGGGLLGGMSMSDWLRLASFLYSAYKANQPPKFTNAPLTPTEKWDAQTKEGMFNALAPYVSQYLSGLGNLQPNFSYTNSLTGNPSFMGGLQIPHMSNVNIPTQPVTPNP